MWGCVCVCYLSWYESTCESAHFGVFGATAHQCVQADALLRALRLDSGVCSITAPTHACLAGLAALPQAAHPFISILLTPADKSSHGALKLPVPALFKTFAFPRDGN